MARQQSKTGAEHVTGVSDVAYDVLMMLSNLLEGTATLQEYKRDARDNQEVANAFDQIEQHHRDGIQQLQKLLPDLLRAH